jgi:hypothetical protein
VQAGGGARLGPAQDTQVLEVEDSNFLENPLALEGFPGKYKSALFCTIW